jgi:hypothetical protein
MWEEETSESRHINDSLRTPHSTVKAEEQDRFGGLPTPPQASYKFPSTPIVSNGPQHSIFSSASPIRSRRMAAADHPRLPESSLAPKPFAGTAFETDYAERWMCYVKKYIDYRHLRDDEALTLFKLLRIDQAQDWLYPLPEGQADSFQRLWEAFMQRYTPNPLQRYQTTSHMWSRN